MSCIQAIPAIWNPLVFTVPMFGKHRSMLELPSRADIKEEVCWARHTHTGHAFGLELSLHFWDPSRFSGSNSLPAHPIRWIQKHRNTWQRSVGSMHLMILLLSTKPQFLPCLPQRSFRALEPRNSVMKPFHLRQPWQVNEAPRYQLLGPWPLHQNHQGCLVLLGATIF